MAGLWQMGSVVKLHHHASNAWKHCPQTHQVIHNVNFDENFYKEHTKMTKLFLSHHIPKYTCANVSHVPATYRTDCHILPQSRSLRVIHAQSKSPRITYVGDSLIAQYYLSAACAVEEHAHIHHTPRVHTGYIQDMFLRGDYPCHTSCASLPKEKHDLTGSFSICQACPDGTPISLQSYLDSEKFWMHHIPNDTSILVLGSGSWYNLHKGLLNSTHAYLEMLTSIAPRLGKFIAQTQTHVYWVGLPPSDSTLSYLEAYEYSYFRGKDDLAYRILSEVGVQFINITQLLQDRKEKDQSIKSDHLHWCNPGAHSVPHFINEIIWHLSASRYVQERHGLLSSLHGH
ncbi:hypothetical protein EON65_29980 [archaeon]|nr:MAG: hypothetical protein EON65_29980 [archaeon]